MTEQHECEWKLYSKEAYTQMRPYVPGEDLSGVSVSDEDLPKLGDMIARNASNHNDKWLIAKEYFDDNYVPVPDHPSMERQSLYERMRTAKCGDVYSYVARLESRLNEYETLKKATEALSAERASKMADEMESGRRISTSRHIRELRVYVAILERK